MRLLAYFLIGFGLAIIVAVAMGGFKPPPRSCADEQAHAKESGEVAKMCASTPGCSMSYSEVRAVVQELSDAEHCR